MINKYLFFVVIFCIIIFSFNICYGVNLSKITGFDGNTYYLNSVPDVADDYNYFIVVKTGEQFHILCFNDSLEITKDSSRIYISGDDGVTLEKITCNFEGASFVDRGNFGSISYSLSSSSVIYSCDELLEYASSMRNDISFTFPSSSVDPEEPVDPVEPENPEEPGEPVYPVEPEEPEEPVVPDWPFHTTSCVSESVQDVNFSLLFSEIFSILPVVLTVCISFIAIRKGISFIRNLLVKP